MSSLNLFITLEQRVNMVEHKKDVFTLVILVLKWYHWLKSFLHWSLQSLLQQVHRPTEVE